MTENNLKIVQFIKYWFISSLISFAVVSFIGLTGLSEFTIDKPASFHTYLISITTFPFLPILFSISIGVLFAIAAFKKKYGGIDIVVFENSIKIERSSVFGQIKLMQYTAHEIDFIKHDKTMNLAAEDSSNLLIIKPKNHKAIAISYSFFNKPFYIELYNFAISNKVNIYGFTKDDIEYDDFEKQHNIYSSDVQ